MNGAPNTKKISDTDTSDTTRYRRECTALSRTMTITVESTATAAAT